MSIEATEVWDHHFEPGERGYGELCKHCRLARASHMLPPGQPPKPPPTEDDQSEPPDDQLPLSSTFEINMLDEHFLLPPNDE